MVTGSPNYVQCGNFGLHVALQEDARRKRLKKLLQLQPVVSPRNKQKPSRFCRVERCISWLIFACKGL